MKVMGEKATGGQICRGNRCGREVTDTEEKCLVKLVDTGVRM